MGRCRLPTSELAAKGGRVSLHPHLVSELAHRLTESGRKKSRGRQCDPLVENIVLGGEIERKLQGTSPIEAFKDFLDLKQHIPNPVPHGKRLNRLREKLVLRGDILQGTSPIEVYFVHSPNAVPHGKRLIRLNEIARKKNVSQSTAEKARAASNRFLRVANQYDPLEDPPNS